MDIKKFVRVGTCIILLKDGKVLLGKRNSDPDKADSELHGEGTWTLPGGKMEFQENFEDAIARETLEETGIVIDKNRLSLVSVSNEHVHDAHFVTIGWLCENFDGVAKVMEPDEIVEWQWFDIHNLPFPLFSPSDKALKNYLSNVIYKH